MSDSLFTTYRGNLEIDCWESAGNFLMSPLHEGFGATIYAYEKGIVSITERTARIACMIFACTIWLPLTLLGIAAYVISKTHDENYTAVQKLLHSQENSKKELVIPSVSTPKVTLVQTTSPAAPPLTSKASPVLATVREPTPSAPATVPSVSTPQVTLIQTASPEVLALEDKIAGWKRLLTVAIKKAQNALLPNTKDSAQVSFGLSLLLKWQGKREEIQKLCTPEHWKTVIASEPRIQEAEKLIAELQAHQQQQSSTKPSVTVTSEKKAIVDTAAVVPSANDNTPLNPSPLGTTQWISSLDEATTLPAIAPIAGVTVQSPPPPSVGIDGVSNFVFESPVQIMARLRQQTEQSMQELEKSIAEWPKSVDRAIKAALETSAVGQRLLQQCKEELEQLKRKCTEGYWKTCVECNPAFVDAEKRLSQMLWVIQ